MEEDKIKDHTEKYILINYYGDVFVDNAESILKKFSSTSWQERAGMLVFSKSDWESLVLKVSHSIYDKEQITKFSTNE